MRQRESTTVRRTSELVALAFLLPLSLIVTAATNRVAGQVLNSGARSFAWIATTAFPSFLLISGLYAVLGATDALRWPSAGTLSERRVVGLSLAWLGLWISGLAGFAVATGHWTIYARGWPGVTAFLVFGPMGEELLFRGIIFGRARTIWPASPTAAIALSTMAFSLHHHWLNTAPNGLAVAQLLFTLPMGVVFATVRERSGSVWPAVLLHVATNVPSAIPV